MKKTGRQTKGNVQKRSSIGIILIVVVAALMFATGFFLAGRQHFSSLDYGMKNSKLRKQVEELESEKRRLILAREISLSPNEIKKAAKKAGLLVEPATEPAIAAVVQTSARPRETEPPAKTAPAPSNPLVIKTASVARTRAPVVPASLKSERADRPRVIEPPASQMRRTVAAE